MEILQLKSKIAGMKTSLEELHSKFGMAEERISDLKDRLIKKIQSEEQREKVLTKNSLRGSGTRSSITTYGLLGNTEGEEREKKRQKKRPSKNENGLFCHSWHCPCACLVAVWYVCALAAGETPVLAVMKHPRKEPRPRTVVMFKAGGGDGSVVPLERQVPVVNDKVCWWGWSHSSLGGRQLMKQAHPHSWK